MFNKTDSVALPIRNGALRQSSSEWQYPDVAGFPSGEACMRLSASILYLQASGLSPFTRMQQPTTAFSPDENHPLDAQVITPIASNLSC